MLGFVLVFAALLQTWLSPIVNLWSGLACLAVLVMAYRFAKPHREDTNARSG